MRNKLLLILGIALLTAAIVWLDYSHSNPFLDQEKNVQIVNKPAPDFTLVTVDTQTLYHLSDFKGKTVLINFWASWCQPCLYEYPLLVELARAHPENLVLIMLSSDPSAKQAHTFTRDFFIKRGVMQHADQKLFPTIGNIYVAWDKDQHITRDLFGSVRYPESILINPEGLITQKFIGVLTEGNMAEIKGMLDQ